ncbi:MAG: DUF4325 domain-containing protein [Candidatus Omnitrophica bacterium]|nr:DUF4325 domain-containing protein [Candidatus Omnitrophota bacterium]
MKTKELILKLARERGMIQTSDIVKKSGLSRQTVVQHFRELIADHKLVKLHSTRNATYLPYRSSSKRPSGRASAFSSRYRIKGLSEDRVFQEADLRMGLKRSLSPAAYQIAGYAFTEMLNNAIDHSRSRHVTVRLECGQGHFEFHVVDTGIGVFESVRRKFGLRDPFESASHLLKGKQTRDPKRHSGQGIFFTSKIADRFSLQSARLELVVDNVIDDTMLNDIQNRRGTRVIFTLKQKSRKALKALFDEYSNSDFEFDKTKVVVRLSAREGEYISRSQAKRLLLGLEKFKRIVLDFKRVKGVGQGFADEVFRVFKAAHPFIQIETTNTSPSVEYLVKRARVL